MGTKNGYASTKFILLFLIMMLANVRMDAQEQNMNLFPLKLSAEKGTQKTLVIYITGDGGITDFSKSFIRELEQKGYGVVALNSRKYFWDQKNPGDFAHDIESIGEYYLKAWGKSSLAIVGYSFGADVTAFLPNTLSLSFLNKIKILALVSPTSSTDFIIRLSDLILEKDNANRKYKLEPELQKVNFPIIVFFGKEEQLLLKDSLKKNEQFIVYELPGEHKYDNNPGLLIKLMGF